MADSINNKAKEYYDNDNTGGSLNNNLKDFLKQQGAEGNSLNTLWRNYAYGEGGNSLNTRLGKLWGTSGSLIKRWKDVLGLTWDDLKLFFNARRNDPELLLSGATSFDGTDDYISIADSDSLSFGDGSTDSALTFSAWVKANDVTLFYIISKGIYNTSAEYSFFINSSNKLIARFFDESVNSTYIGREYSTGVESYEGKWTHIVTTYDGSSNNSGVKIYINGLRVDNADNNAGSYVAMENLGAEVRIGSSTTGSAFTDGKIANVGIWNRALSSSEIESIYWKGQYADLKGTELTNLVSWYNLKETEYSSELITNGGFDDASNWDIPSGGWDINSTTSGKAHYLDDGSGIDYIRQNIQLIQGAVYRLKFTLSDGTNSQLAIYNNVLGSYVTLLSSSPSFAHFTPTANGTYTIDFRAIASGSFLIAGHPNGSSFNIDDVSVQEIQTPDSTGTNNGTVVGATTLTDAYSASSPFLPRIQDKASDTVANYGEVYGGNAVSFDGVNDFIDIDSVISSISSNTVGTLSTWVNFADLTTDFDTLFGFTDGGASGTNRFVLRVNNTNNELNVHYASGGTTQWRFETDNTYNTGQWYFLQLVQDGTEPKLYIDGTEQSITYTTATDKTQWFNNLGTFSDARIGCEDIGGNTRFISGKINNVKIFSTALTQDQIRELYTKPELTLPTGVASSALKLDMPMQEGSGVAILDGSGNQNHGTGSGITWATGQEYGFQHPLVRSNNPMVFDGSDDKVTIGDSSPLDGFTKFSISAYVYQKTLSNGGIIKKYAYPNISYLLYLNNSGKINLRISSNGTTVEDQVSVGAITADIWNHVLITFDAGTFKAYINGSSVGVDANFSTQTSVFAGSADVVIGNAIWSGYYFNGMINDVAIWDSALTANEVTALYNSGLPLLPTADSGNYASADDLVGYWRNDGVTTWIDRSTNSNNGTVSGSPASIIVPEGLNEGRDSQGYYLTDTDSISSGIRFKGAEYINVQDSESLDFANAFTIETWIKPKQKNVYQIFLQKGTGTKSPRLNIAETNGQYTLDIVIGGSHNYVNSTNDAVIVDQWQHLVVTWNGSTGKMYIDGSQNATASISGTQDLNTDPLTIGKSSSSYFTGSLDEVKLYSKELSASEVLKNYNNGKSAHSN